jgi:hypothetical protein
MPREYDKIATLHIAKGRELDFHTDGGVIHYMRETPNPKFKELMDLTKKGILPSWLERKDIA